MVCLSRSRLSRAGVPFSQAGKVHQSGPEHGSVCVLFRAAACCCLRIPRTTRRSVAMPIKHKKALLSKGGSFLFLDTWVVTRLTPVVAGIWFWCVRGPQCRRQVLQILRFSIPDEPVLNNSPQRALSFHCAFAARKALGYRSKSNRCIAAWLATLYGAKEHNAMAGGY